MEKLENQVIKNIYSNNRSYKSMNVDCNVCLRSFVFFPFLIEFVFLPISYARFELKIALFSLYSNRKPSKKIGMSCFIMGKSVFPQRLLLLVFQFRNVKLKVYRNTDRNEVGKKVFEQFFLVFTMHFNHFRGSIITCGRWKNPINIFQSLLCVYRIDDKGLRIRGK